MRYSKFKKVGVLLPLCLALSSFVGCTSKTLAIDNNQDIVVLNNQEQEINDTLKLEKIKEINSYKGLKWLDNDKVVGYTLKEDVMNLCIYNAANGKTENITNNDKNRADTYYVLEETNINDKGTANVIYTQYGTGKEVGTYVVNLEDLTKIHIGSEIYRGTKVENGRYVFTEGNNLFLYDFNSNTNTEIKIPIELYNKVFEFNSTCEEWVTTIIPDEKRRNQLSKRDLDVYAEMYVDYKADNKIDELVLEGNSLYISSYSNIGYKYNLITKEYKQEDFDSDPYNLYGYRRAIDSDEGSNWPTKLVEIDKYGKIVTTIDTNNITKISNSPNNSKVAYFSYTNFDDNPKLNIYEFDSKKSFSVDASSDGRIIWNKASTRFFYSSMVNRVLESSYWKYNTSIYTLY